MKAAIRIFNVIIMALSIAATIFLFTTKTFSFNSVIGVDLAELSEFVPETEYTEDVDVVELLGTDEIKLSFKFALDYVDLNQITDGSRNAINIKLLDKNLDKNLETLHEPIHLIAEYLVRYYLKQIIQEKATEQIDIAREQYQENHPESPAVTTEEIMDEACMDDAYFANLADTLYEDADSGDATVDSLSDLLFTSLDEALEDADETGLLDLSTYTAEVKEQIKENLLALLTDLQLINEDNTIKKISELPYLYIANHIKTALEADLTPEELEQKPDETNVEYGDRMIKLFIYQKIPGFVYTIIGTIAIGLLIGFFAFLATWIFLFVFTLAKTFTKKPWTLFGPWYWIVGILQVVLGVGLTVFGKFIVPRLKIASFIKLPLKTIILAPRTCALVPSIIFLVTIVIAIIYGFLKRSLKKKMKQ